MENFNPNAWQDCESALKNAPSCVKAIWPPKYTFYTEIEKFRIELAVAYSNVEMKHTIEQRFTETEARVDNFGRELDQGVTKLEATLNNMLLSAGDGVEDVLHELADAMIAVNANYGSPQLSAATDWGEESGTGRRGAGEFVELVLEKLADVMISVNVNYGAAR
ncbi:hypothetical protein K440DRAFT_671932 [Wilcoxina mikolae CBS 423.85]|nr:hypothetical protein K440DRAFT_671932 [Wilcoxina mikolae CBS 423.85]